VSGAEQRVRVLMMIDAVGPESGGGERFAFGLARALPSDRYAVTLCTTRSAGAEERAELERGGVEVLDLSRRGRFDFRSFRPLLRRLRSGTVDVLHAHKFGSNVWGVGFGRGFRVPVVIAHEQTWSYRGNPGRVALDFLIGRLADAFVAVSSADGERMVTVEHVPADKVTVIPNAHIPREPVEENGLRQELGLEADDLLIGTVAVMRPQKALSLLVDAFAGLAARHPEAHLILGGDGPCEPELREQVAQMGLDDRVHFLGLRQDVPEILSSLDIAVMSSDFEGTPLFALECMAAGTPLVATRVGGLPDLVDDGVTGTLVPPRDAAALGAAIDELISNPERRDAVAAAARKRSVDFSIDRIAERFGALYRSLLDQARS
jgi:glycosyltransferase involved in cell wall biosynthesis